MVNLILSRSDNPNWEILVPQDWAAALSKPIKVVDKERHGACRDETSAGCSGWDLGQKKTLDKN